MTTAAEPSDPLPEPLLDALRRAARIPRYLALLRENSVDPTQIRSIGGFRQALPVVRKDDLFNPEVPLADLCPNGFSSGIRGVMASSGFSGNNSYCLISAQEKADTQRHVDAGLDLLFSTNEIETLIINALSMGVHVDTGYTLAETSARSDLVLNLLRKAGPYYGQTVVIGDPHFIKRVVDEGNGLGIDWARLGVSFVYGGDWMPETLRTYMATETGIDLDSPSGQRAILGSMGLTELGLHIFFETRATVCLRRLAMTDEQSRNVLLGCDSAVIPNIFHYDPRRFFIEGVPHPEGRELACTTLSPQKLTPLVRYATGDLGDIIDSDSMTRALASLGLSSLAPSLPLPLAIVHGRPSSLRAGPTRLRVEALRHGLYSDHAVASSVTGHFWLHGVAPNIECTVQLRPGIAPEPRLTVRVQAGLFSQAQTELPTKVLRYEDYPYGKELNFEIKFRHHA